ncbi:magnesium-translocating P-type ATPase [Singulisphaera acidiphila]|nr:magnesium-translocating P-type ATPase [Singulisphaera acidiphila]
MMPTVQLQVDRNGRQPDGLIGLNLAHGSAEAIPLVNEEAARPIADVLVSLQSSPDGIGRLYATSRRARYGRNEVAHERAPAWYLQLLYAGRNPFILLLLTLALVSVLVEDYKAASIITVMVAVSVLLRFVQEYRSNRAAEALQEMVGTTATVSRPGPRITATLPDAVEPIGRHVPRHPPTTEETPIKHLVPGDVVLLSAGDMIPADVVLLGAKDLFVSQSILTGESLPVEKFAHPFGTSSSQANGTVPAGHALDVPNACFMGTNVVSGTARALVVATGSATYLGRLAKSIVGRRTLTAFDVGINGVSWLLIRFMLVMVPVVFVINGWTKGSWIEAFFFAVSVAVGLTPEMLPMIVTANLARGAVAMARKKVVVKRLDAIQNLGAMDLLCTDKTGTLTRDKVVLLRHLDLNGDECEGVFEYAFLNSYFQTGLKNLLDKAVLEHQDQLASKRLPQRYLKCDEVPFDFNRRRMSVVVHEVLHGRDLLICKGAVEEVAAACTRVRVGEEVVPLVDAARDRVLNLSRGMNEDGLRVIAVAYKEVESQAGRPYGVQDEDDLILCGFLSFLDPPKETAAPAIAALQNLGVGVKILTGDNERVARKVCRDVGLEVAEILLGPAIEAMEDDELGEAAERATLLAKLTPAQKARIIRALRSRGHTVGFLGDGINDGPALREADVGISVDSGADVARESSDIILLEKSLLVLEEGVVAGRVTFGNILKYIKMATSSNFGNMFSVLVACVWLPFLPMRPLHLLIQNLLYDISQTGIPFDRVDEEFLVQPRKWQADDIGRFMLFIGPISSIFDLTTFALMWFVFGANTPEQQALFQSGWFVEGLLSQTLIIHMIRTERVPFFQSRAALRLLLMSLGIMAVGIAIPFTTLGSAVGMVPLPAAYFPWLAGTLVSYCTLTQLVKRWYIRRFGTWL